jgi:flagellar basal-body rod protein FlgB
METNNPGLMDLLVRKMSYLNQKQVVHAENVANANTPGYRVREVAPFSFGDALKQAGVGMTVTDPRHIVPASMAGANAITVKTKGSSDKNALDVEQQSMQVSQTGAEYQLVTSIYHKIAGLFKIALKGSSA